MAKEEKKEEKPKSKKKLFMIGGGAVGLIVVLLALKMFMFGSHKTIQKKTETKTVPVQATETPQYVEPKNLVAVPLKPIIVNLADPSGERYLKVDIVLVEAGSHKKKKEGEENTLQQAIIRNTIIDILSSKTSTELLTNEGKQALRKELVKAINKALNANIVRKIYFTSFIIQ